MKEFTLTTVCLMWVFVDIRLWDSITYQYNLVGLVMTIGICMPMYVIDNFLLIYFAFIKNTSFFNSVTTFGEYINW